MSRESTRKHRDHIIALHLKREGRPIEELGPERLENELDLLEDEGDVFHNDEFDKAVANDLLAADGLLDFSKVDRSQRDRTDHGSGHLIDSERQQSTGPRLFFDTKTQSIEDIANEFWDKTHETE